MRYRLLSSVYYEDINEYNKLYDERIKSEYAFHTDIDINGSHAFFLRLPELYENIISLYKKDQALVKLLDALPDSAVSQYISKSMIGEIMGTNDIENIHSTRKEVHEAVVCAKKAGSKRFRSIANRYEMLKDPDYDMPLKDCSDIRKIYDELLYEEIRAEDMSNLPDGHFFRRSQVTVNSVTDKVLHIGVFPEEKIIEQMNRSLRFLGDDNVNTLFRTAVFHYLFGYIHPFYDGNGRLNRFISCYLLQKEFKNKLIGFRLSYTVKENINKYYKAFNTCNDPKNKGDITPFVIMMLEIIDRSMSALLESLEEKSSRLSNYEKNIGLLPYAENKKYAAVYSVLIQAALFSEIGMSRKEITEIADISLSTVRWVLRETSEELIDKRKMGSTTYFSLNLNAFGKIIDDRQEQ